MKNSFLALTFISFTFLVKAQSSFTADEFNQFTTNFPTLALPLKIDVKSISEKVLSALKPISDEQHNKFLTPKSEMSKIGKNMKTLAQFAANEDIICLLIADDNSEKATNTMDRNVFAVYYSKSKNEITIQDHFKVAQDYSFNDAVNKTFMTRTANIATDNTITLTDLTKSYTGSKADNKNPEVFLFKPDVDFREIVYQN